MKYVKLTRRGNEVMKSLQSLDGALGGGSLLKDLKRMELRVNRIEGRLKTEGIADRTVKRTVKSLEDLATATAVIEAEAAMFGNDRLDYEIRVMKERLIYLGTKLPPVESPPEE
jgi:hypothetical protein